MPRGTIKATVLIETLPAAFEMEEILYELRQHSAGLNAGRWDYIFSSIKCFPDRPEMVLPDRGDVTMTVPFMRAYAELLAATCHRRGAHAMGGMAALIPSRKDEEANKQGSAGVRADKEREVGQGYDGTWVAHPDLVATAPRGVRAGAQRRPQPARAPARRRRRHRRAAAGPEVHPRRDHRGGTADGRQRRVPVRVVLARRPRRRCDQLADGGRRHRRDLPLADLAVGSPRSTLEDGRTITPELVRQVLDEETSQDPRRQSATRPGRPGAPPRPARSSSASRCLRELIEFLTIPAYEYLD